MASRILCTQHNADLSGLDDVAVKLFDAVDEFGVLFREESAGQAVFAMNGHDLERWMLKALCGLLAGKQVRDASAAPWPTEVPNAWVQVLFGQHILPPRTGIYVSGRIGETMSHDRMASLSPVFADGELAGAVATFRSFRVILTLASVGATSGGLLSADDVWRPQRVVVRRGNRESLLYFHWDEASSGAGVQLTWNPPAR